MVAEAAGGEVHGRARRGGERREGQAVGGCGGRATPQPRGLQRSHCRSEGPMITWMESSYRSGGRKGRPARGLEKADATARGGWRATLTVAFLTLDSVGRNRRQQGYAYWSSHWVGREVTATGESGEPLQDMQTLEIDVHPRAHCTVHSRRKVSDQTDVRCMH